MKPITIYKLDVKLIDRGRRAQFSHTMEELRDFDEELLTKRRKPDFKAIYKFAVKRFGRCASKMYVDATDGKTAHVGWVFQKREPYEDRRGGRKETFLQEAWVSVLAVVPEQRSVMEVT